MKLLYATSLSYPSRLTNRRQTHQMARAFARLLARGQFVFGARGLDEPFVLPIPKAPKSFTLAWRYARYAKRERVTHILCREPRLVAFMAIWLCFPLRHRATLVFEVHQMAPRFDLFEWFAVRAAGRLIVLTTPARDEIARRFNLLPSRICIAPDGLDMRDFADMPECAAARIRCGLPPDVKIAMYTGHLYDWKGIHTLAEAARLLPESTLVVFVGGKEKDVAVFAARHGSVPNIRIIGHRPYEEMPAWLAAADVLVLPNSGRHDISRIFTSPLKLFEYLAAGKPIVASDLPSFRDVLDSELVIFAAPDDARAFKDGIERALAAPGDRAIGAKRRALAEAYDWHTRARRIIDFIQENGDKENGDKYNIRRDYVV